MAFSVNDIRTNLKFGGARPTLFQVQLNAKFNTELSLASPFMVQAASLPASTINPIEVSYWGRKIKVAGDRTFDNWQVTVINDEDFKVRHILETWHNRINSLVGNLQTSTASPDIYKEDATVTQFTKAARTETSGQIRTYKFVGLFPLQIGPIELSWEDNNRIETFQVEFSYDYYTVSGGPGTVQ
jgi:hypothetical protein